MSLDDDVEEESKWVRLISQEGHEFILERRLVEVSSTISAALQGKRWQEAQGRIPTMRLPEITTCVLEIVCKFCHHKDKCSRSQEPMEQFPISNDDLINTICAAHFLDM